MATELHKSQARDRAAGGLPAAAFSQRAKVLTAAHTITAAENGTTFYLDSATEFAVTLPKPLLGLHYKIIVAAAPSGADYTVVTNGGDNIIEGGAVSAAAATPAGAPAADEDTITFVDGTSLAGDSVELWADGTNWYVKGLMSANGGITFTSS